MKSVLLFPLLLGGLMPCQHVRADAATELSQAMESRKPVLSLDLRAHLSDAPRVRFLEDDEVRAFLADHRQQLLSLDSTGFKKLGLDDPMLQAAYIEMFRMSTMCGNGTVPNWFFVAREDLQRRGDAATPLLIEFLASFSEPQFGEELFFNIEEFTSISLTPYVNVARSYCSPPRPDITERAWRAVTHFLSRRGNAQDLDLLLGVNQLLPSEKRPPLFQSDIVRMKKRLNGTLKPTEWHGRPPDGYDWPASTTPQQQSEKAK